MPEVGSSNGTWGTKLNVNLGDDTTTDSIDTVVKAVSDVADAALPKAGGVMTGRLAVKTETGTVTALTSQTGTTTIDLSLGQAWTITFSGNPTFVFSNTPTGGSLVCFVLKVTALSTRTVTWPATVKWTSGTQPVWTSGVDTVGFITFDGGTSWYGALIASNLS